MNRTLPFQMSGKLIFGKGALEELPEAVRRIGAGKAFVVTDPGLVRAGIAEKLLGILSEADVSTALYDKVEPDPRIEVVWDCHEAARSSQCEVLIGLGGGSALDTAKVTAVLLGNSGALQDYFGIDNIPHRGLPTVMIPTTAGTGSEVTPIAVLSDKQAQLKKGIVSDHLYADVALIDPELAVTLPPQVTAYTGVDALTHAIEAYTNKFAHPFIDTFALAAIQLIGRYLKRAVAEGSDLEARYHMAMASLYGGMCLGSVNTAAVHAMAYPLGGMFDVPHGMANALLLPYVMQFNLESCPERFARIADALGRPNGEFAAAPSAEASVDAVRELCSEVGIVSRLGDLDIPEESIDQMAAGALKVTRLMKNNPRAMTLQDVKTIYRAAY
ncbi:MAG: iron-containing alcohol dehydrogenase [Planctomycetes bacterium]|nr:iron-containing alcohol dehydrogenase [Planctomycetota bacterium]